MSSQLRKFVDDLIDKKQVSRKKAVEGVTALLEMADRRQKLCCS